MARLVLKPGMDRRLRAGHPWVYRGEIADLVGRWIPGDTVEVLDAGGHFLGRGFYNPRPSLACRLLTTLDDFDFLSGAVTPSSSTARGSEAAAYVRSERGLR